MNHSNGALPPRLQEIVEDFNFIEGREKLEYLLEFSEQLPPLPAWLADKRSEMVEVHECITPIFVYAEGRDGKLHYHFDVPPEGPTVRGYAEILRQGVDGLTADEVVQIPNEFYLSMGLQSVLSGQRLNGISAILAYMKQLATPYLSTGTGGN